LIKPDDNKSKLFNIGKDSLDNRFNELFADFVKKN